METAHSSLLHAGIYAQILEGFLREADSGVPMKELVRRHGFSSASFYQWRAKFSGMTVPEAKRLRDLEQENTRLKRLLAEATMENDIHKATQTLTKRRLPSPH